MPIGIDRFDDADALDDLPTSVRVLRFLGANDEQAFTRREIADAVDAAPETVGTNLTRLKERGLVRHREPYWAAPSDPERVRQYLLDRYDRERVDGLLAADDGAAAGEVDQAGADADSAVDGAHRDAAAAFVDRVEEALDGAVAELYLFGSVARGDATPSSDVDVLAVVDEDADYRAVDDRLLAIAYDVQLEHGVPVEVHSMTEGEFAARAERGEPFVSAVVEEGTTRV